MAIPRAATVKKTVQKEIVHLVERINSKFGSLENKPVVYFERNITFTERIALYRCVWSNTRPASFGLGWKIFGKFSKERI